MQAANVTSPRGTKRRLDQETDALDESYELSASSAFDFKQMDDLVRVYSMQRDESRSSNDRLECHPRAYEEEFLREPIGAERQCIRNGDCQGLQITGCSGFILREFIPPSAITDDIPSQPRGMCIMCRRYEVARLFYRYLSTGAELPSDVKVSNYYNLVGVTGEYDVRDCIVSQGQYAGLSMPVVLHTRCAYIQETVKGTQWYRQAHLRCPGQEGPMNGPFLTRRATLQTHMHSSAAHTST